jgi:hypothetical protein
METTTASEWTAIANACPISVEELPIAGTPEEQAQFLRDYLARVRDRDDYECYACIERVLTKLESAETSPFMDA